MKTKAQREQQHAFKMRTKEREREAERVEMESRNGALSRLQWGFEHESRARRRSGYVGLPGEPVRRGG